MPAVIHINHFQLDGLKLGKHRARGGLNSKRFTTDVLRYGLPIHPCRPESFRDNLYDLTGFIKAIFLRHLRIMGIPISKASSMFDLISDEETA